MIHKLTSYSLILTFSLIASFSFSQNNKVISGKSDIKHAKTTEPDMPKMRGSGDPLKGLNVARAEKMIIGNYYALIIGIDTYTGTWTALENAVRDAKAIKEIFFKIQI